MNVAFDPWIPVVTTSGRPTLISLYDALTEGEKFSDLAVRPHERVSLMRLLLCVAHAALDGPKDYDEWLEIPDKLPECAQKYLEKWKDSFELFHDEKPWLQIATLSKTATKIDSESKIEDWTPVSKLNFSFASGNNTTLFDHEGMREKRELPIHETILSMLTYQCFSPGGLISQVFWAGVQSGKSSKDGPCVPASMIHTFLRYKTLNANIQFNLPSYEDIKLVYGTRKFGHPIWEMRPNALNDTINVENATETYIGRLVPMTRLIRLHPSGERMLLGDGLVYPTFTDGFPPEPSATVVIRQNGKKEERTLLSYRPTRALWRELAAISVKRSAEGPGGPLSLRTIQDEGSCDLVVAALSRDQATIVDTKESVFHIPARLLISEGIDSYDAEVKRAEGWSNRLGWAVEGYRLGIDGGWEGRTKNAGPKVGELKRKLHATATTHYWTAVEKNLSLLMAHIKAMGTENAIPTREVWRKILFVAAREAYQIACGQETPRQIRAFAEGWRRLTAKKDEPLESTDKTQKEAEE